MKIYINARFLTQKIRGVQRYAVEIAKHLRRKHPDLMYISPKGIIHKELAKELDVFTLGRSSGYLWEQTELPMYLIKQGSPLLLNLVNTAPLFYKNSVVAIHDLAFLRNPQWFTKKFSLYYKFMVPRIAQNSLKVITVSNFSKKEIVNFLRVPNKKVEVIYNAVSKDFSNNSSNPFGKEYGEYVLAVSSLDPRKNLKNLILAFNKTGLSNTKLLIAGIRDQVFAEKEVMNLISSNRNIIFLGHILSDEDLSGLYNNAALFIYPSLYEGFGLPPLEAMACGCPVAVSNTTSLPEVCGDAAYYIDPNDVANITEGICDLLRDNTLRQNLIQKGIERAGMFSWEESAERMYKVIAEML